MSGDTRRRRAGLLLAVFALFLAGAAAPALAGCDPCCDRMEPSMPGGCEALAAAGCCEAPVAAFSTSSSQAPPAAAAFSALVPTPCREPSLRAPLLDSPVLLQSALIRSVVLRL